jgi:hypothetical protein
MLGCDLPATPMPASKGNAKGFFESLAIRDFNDELLAAAGSSWDDFTRFHEDWLQSPHAEGFLDRAVRLLEDEFGTSPLFVLKDPRICRLVPFWREALRRSGCSVKPILTVRNPLEVAHSLQTKKEYSEPLSEMIWLRHALDAERDTRGTLRFHTSFEQLMHGWEVLAEKAQRDLGLTWPKPVANVEFEVSGFLSGDLRHHEEAQARVLSSALIPGWLRAAYDILNRWAASGEDPADHARLDRIRDEFDVASQVFARVVRAERLRSLQSRERAQQLQDKVADLEGELADARTSRTSIEKALDEAKAAGDEARATLQARINALSAEASQREQQLENEKARRSELEAQLKGAAQEADRQRSENEAQLKALRDEADKHRAAFEQIQVTADRERAEAELQMNRLKMTLQEQRRRNTLMEAEFHQQREALQDELSQVRSDLEASQARRKEASRVIARRDAEIEARYKELAILQREILQSSLSGRLRKLLSMVNRPGGEPSAKWRPAAGE